MKKLILGRVAQELSWLRRVASEGSPKITKTDNFTALEPPIAV